MQILRVTLPSAYVLRYDAQEVRRVENHLGGGDVNVPAPEESATGSAVLRWLIRAEYLIFSSLVIVAAWLHRDQAGWLFWLWLLLPDIPLVLVPFTGEPISPQRFPRLVVPSYNATHTLLAPVVVLAALWLATGTVPWYLSGWFLHVGLDRMLGFGLRARDGTVSGLPA